MGLNQKINRLVMVIYFCIGLHNVSIAEIDDISFGSETAPLKIIQFTSYSCDDCAEFHKEKFPEMKRLVDQGKIHLTVKGYPRNGHDGMLTALGLCIYSDQGIEAYFEAEEQIFARQNEWFVSDQAASIKVMSDIAQSFGYSEKDFEACRTNVKVHKILGRTIDHAREEKIPKFPGFVLTRNEEISSSELETLDNEITFLLQFETVKQDPSQKPIVKPPVVPKAEMLIKCRSGNWQSCYDYSGSSDKGWSLMHSLCDDESIAGACEFVATIYKVGSVGVEKDLDKSVEYYDKACELGHISSCNAKSKLILE